MTHPALPDANHETDPDVIVVQDDADLAAMLGYALETAAVSTRVYTDGASALEEILALPRVNKVRLLLLAVDLPGIGGHSIHERVTAERPREFVAAFISARENEAEELRALGTGAIDYLARPVSIAVLRAKVRNWISVLRGEA